MALTEAIKKGVDRRASRSVQNKPNNTQAHPKTLKNVFNTVKSKIDTGLTRVANPLALPSNIAEKAAEREKKRIEQRKLEHQKTLHERSIKAITGAAKDPETLKEEAKANILLIKQKYEKDLKHQSVFEKPNESKSLEESTHKDVVNREFEESAQKSMDTIKKVDFRLPKVDGTAVFNNTELKEVNAGLTLQHS